MSAPNPHPMLSGEPWPVPGGGQSPQPLVAVLLADGVVKLYGEEDRGSVLVPRAALVPLAYALLAAHVHAGRPDR